jgi:exonuclease SbcC
MLNKLSYSVTFPTTGRTLAGELGFNPGFGVITGANEQGKSFIIEVVRWCLFGSAALRGKAEDYKTLRASSTNSSGTTTFYDSRGNVTGRVSRR